MKPKSFIAPNMIHALMEYASSTGIDLINSRKAAQLKAKINANPEARLPASQFYALWSDIASQSRDPHFGLHFAERTRAKSHGDVLSAVMFNCPSVGSALEKLTRYHALTTDLIQIKIHTDEQLARCAWESDRGGFPIDRHISEAVICWLFFTIKTLGAEKITFEEIRFQHPRPMDTTEHQRIFACPVTFEQSRNEVVFRRMSLNLHIPLANPRLLEPLEAIIQAQLDELYPPDTWSEQVSQAITKLILQGQKPNLSFVAKMLAISTRQLQNKLKAEGCTYRALLDQTRKEMALGYLKEPGINIYDTAFLLGFADQSAFNHAFKRWTGVTPTTFRLSTDQE
jgi:AraC-like DNA-binding protein